jgi:hypothetical protein
VPAGEPERGALLVTVVPVTVVLDGADAESVVDGSSPAVSEGESLWDDVFDGLDEEGVSLGGVVFGVVAGFEDWWPPPWSLPPPSWSLSEDEERLADAEDEVVGDGSSEVP